MGLDARTVWQCSLNGVEWIYLAEDYNKWQAPVNMLMDSQGPQTFWLAEELLDCQGAACCMESFS
jgi:hypothetical protein